MGNTIIYIHGGGAKPDATSLSRYWSKVLNHNMERSHPNTMDAFNDTHHEFVYYGDVTNDHHKSIGESYDPELDIADRNHVVETLFSVKTKIFTSRRGYEQLPGRSLIGELIADVGLPVARLFGLSERVITRVLPDLAHYWEDSDAATTIRTRIQDAIRSATVRRDEIAIVAHCMGSVAAYDALWELTHLSHQDSHQDSHQGSQQDSQQKEAEDRFNWYHGEKIKLLVTLGSPLGDETVKSRLLGADSKDRHYPGNIVKWVNFSAEDDYVSHDNAIRNDYEDMLKERRLSHIEDHRIFNLAVRYGKSNPHSVAGYLIHPRVARTLNEWLS